MFLILVAIGWLYVALMMAVAEATSPIGSVLGALFTFVLYGVGPVALVMYLLGTPMRRRKQREAEAAAAAATSAAAAPDRGGEPPAVAEQRPVAPEREEA